MRGGGGEGGLGGYTLMMYCLRELCQTEYDRLSDFKDLKVCVCSAVVYCVREEKGLACEKNKK